ncbi:MAG: AsmA family protein [Candidatus Delongbacteria bacterium]|jgi:DNA-binding protein YbaB|nr:AsmA family protein [Candidatus Delongbacteria bacterium]
MKKFFKIIIVLIILFILLIVGVNIYITKYFDRDIIVKQVEANLNTRFDLKNIEIGIFSTTPSLILDEIKFAKRDKYANEKIHIDERPELQTDIISIEKIELKANLMPLLQKKFVLNKFLITKPKFEIIVKDNGKNSVTPLFDPPAGKSVTTSTVTEKTERTETEVIEKETKEISASEPKTDTKTDKPFTNKDLPIAADLNQIGIEDARIDIFVEKTQQKLIVNDLDVLISSIDIDPKDLVNHNKATIQFNSDIIITDKEDNEQAKLLIKSQGDIEPFDLKTGEINPEIIYNITIGKSSFISGLVALEKLKTTLSTLSKIGIDLKILSKKAELTKDAETKIKYKEGKVSFLEDLTLETKGYDLALSKDSWFNVLNNQHNFAGNLLISKGESEKILKEVDKFIDEQSAKIKNKEIEFDTAKIKKELLAGLVQDGRIKIEFSSKGDISDPKVKITAVPPSLSKIIQDAVTDAVKDRVNKEVDKAKAKVNKEVDKVKDEAKEKAQKEADKLLEDNKDKIKIPKGLGF